MEPASLSPRLAGLPRCQVHGREVRLAAGPRARLLGLALLPRERAGAGLLIPRCASVHTFGMRFPLDLVFLDADGSALECCRAAPPGRLYVCRRARAVLEIPAGPGGEIAPAAT